MTKEEIILKELEGMFNVPTGVYESNDPITLKQPVLTWGQQKFIDPVKLAKFLAKHLDIKPKDLVEKK